MASDGASPQEEKRIPSRKGLYLPFIVLAFIVCGWSLFWFVSAQKAEAVLDGLLAREAQRGRNWDCPQRAILGFPFRIALSCTNPRYVEAAAGRMASLGGLVLHARIISPGHFIGVLEGPFTFEDGMGRSEFAWQSAKASFRAGFEGFSDASVEVEAAQLTIGLKDFGDFSAKARGFTLHLRRSPGEVAGTDFALKLSDLAFAPLDILLNSPEPMQLEVQASAPGLLIGPEQRLPFWLEAWRAAGGRGRVVLAKAEKGKAMITLSGPLGLDAQHRLEGQLQGRASGLDAITARFTKQSGFDLGGLLGKVGGGQGLPLVLTLENGRLLYGPFPLLALMPLY